MKFCGLILIFLISLNTQASLWVATNQWNENWEAQYSNWVSTEVKSTFFLENKISTDCADAAISLRWIFARINSLPMASTAGAGSITNLSTSWDFLPANTDWKAERRFQTALKSINDSTDTKTLFHDVYPVELNSKNLRPGTLFVDSTVATGHAQWISQMTFDGMNNPITFFSSTVPQMMRDLLVYPFMKPKWPVQNQNGFARFKWAVQSNVKVYLKASVDMQGYSLEQYQLASQFSNTSDFDDFVTERLIGQPLDGLRKLQNLASHLIQRIENRVPVIVAGVKACAPNKCAKDSETFYSHSTYARDGAIQLLIIGITELIYSDNNKKNVDDQIAGQMLARWSQLQTDVKIDLGFKSVELGQIVINWNSALISSDPNDFVQKRWGYIQ